MEKIKKWLLVIYGILTVIAYFVLKGLFNKQSGIPNNKGIEKLKKRRREVENKIANMQSRKTDVKKIKKKYDGKPNSDILATIKRNLKNYKRLEHK